MKIRDILKDNSPHVSFEVFPPKTDAGYEGVRAATKKIAALRPSFISVTYGAGGGTSRNTVRIASQIKNDLGVTSLAHLTCVSSTKDEVRGVIGQLKEQGIENILALRGDIPADGEFPLLPGIMPVTSAKQMKRICDLSGTVLPERFRAILDRFGEDPDAMKQAGIIYATDQIIDLIANGMNHIHIYSMNKPEVAEAIISNLSAIIKA